MVNQTCRIVAKEELKKMGLHFIFLDFGIVDIMEMLTTDQIDELNKNLKKWGLELAGDRKSIIIERIKNTIIEMIQSGDDMPSLKFSEYIGKKLHHDYTYLSNLFTEIIGISIRQYIINYKIERIKELILYDELSISEISYKLKYSSLAHMSNQFKKVTGLTPSIFKQLKQNSGSSAGYVYAQS